MALTNPKWYIIIIGFVVISTLALLQFGNSIESKVDLDADSVAYLSNYSRYVGNAGIENIENTAESSDKENPIESFLSGIPIISEILSVVKTFSSIMTGFWNFAALMFKLPEFFVVSLGLPIAGFGFIINIISYMLFLSLIITVIGVIK